METFKLNKAPYSVTIQWRDWQCCMRRISHSLGPLQHVPIISGSLCSGDFYDFNQSFGTLEKRGLSAALDT